MSARLIGMIEVISFINRRVKRCVAGIGFPRYFLLLAFFIAFLAGIFLANLLFEGLLKEAIFVLIAVLFVVSGKFDFFEKKLFLFILFGVLLGGLRLFFAVQIPQSDVSNYLGKIELRGCIVEEVDVRNDKVKYTIKVSELKIFPDSLWNEASGRVLVTGKRYPVYEYGDCLFVQGKLDKPGKIDDFDYAKYLSRYDVYAVIYQSRIELIEKGKGVQALGWLFNFKSSFENRLGQIFAEPYASFMAGLILGSRKGISEDLMNDFNTTGLSHIVAISGYNITLLIVVVSGLFGFLTRKMKVVASVIFIFIFVVLVGASAAVVRAAVMGVIGLMALWFGRNYFVGISLFSAAFFMNLWNPKILIYDVGFQLSFLATCGLVYVSPFLEKYFIWLPEFFGIRDSMEMTISAQVLALPVILLNFGRLSLISPLANIFVLPFLPIAMIFGFFAVVLSYVWSFLGLLIGFFGYFVLGLIILLVEFFAKVPLAAVSMEWFNFWLAACYYFLVSRWIMRNSEFV